MRRTLRLSVRGRLLLLNLALVAAAILLAGFGVTEVGWWVVARGDLMAATLMPAFQRETLLYLAVVSLLTFLLAGAAAWTISGRLVRPLLRMRAATEAIAAGDYGIRLHEARTDELGDVAAAVDRMAASLAEVERLRRELVANVAHELRTPLTTLQGLIRAIQDGVAAADEETLGSLAEEISRLIRLVEALHHLSVTDRVRSRGSLREPLDLAPLVAEIAAGMRPVFEQKRQRLATALGQLPLTVRGDRDHLVQVLVNLLDNACKYSPEGAEVSVSAVRHDQRITLAVTNTGAEIAPEDLPHVFERFYRGEKSRARASGGVGVGLAIARNLVEAGGGEIAAESGGGTTTFRVSLPVG